MNRPQQNWKLALGNSVFHFPFSIFHFPFSIFRTGLWLLGLSSLLVYPGCKVNEDTVLEKPLGKLVELGVELQYEVVKDPLLTGYVQRIGQTEVAAGSHRGRVPYRFKVVESSEVNAFAIPWGGIYVTKGLLNTADNEEEVAAVIGHEIGHVEGRHAVQAFKRDMLIGLGLSLVGKQVSDDLGEALQIGNYFLGLKYSRDHEYDADRRGVEMCFRSQYDPQGEVEFFGKLQKMYGREPRVSVYFSTHPLHRDRIARVRKMPELSANAAALTRIGRGYAQRGMHAPAMVHFQEALQANPNYGEAHLALARSAAARGERDRAREAYRAAQRYQPTREAAERELAALDRAPRAEAGVRLASAGDWAARQRAAQQANEAALRALQTTGEAPGVQGHLRAALEGLNRENQRLRDEGEQALARLTDLYRVDVQEARIKELVGHLERSMRVANDAFNTLQFAGELGLEALARLRRSHEKLAAFLTQTPQTEADVGLIAKMPQIAASSRQALAHLERVAQGLENTRQDAARTSFLAYQTILDLHADFFGRQPFGGPAQLQNSLDRVERQAQAAFEQAQHVARETAAARSRAFQVAIDASLAGVAPARRELGQNLITYFLLSQPQDFETLREQGYTPGEAALLLGGAQSRQQAPTKLARPGSGYDTLVETLQEERVNLEHVNILLKLLSNTLEQEMADV